MRRCGVGALIFFFFFYKSTSLKLNSLNRKLYLNMVSTLKIRLETSLWTLVQSCANGDYLNRIYSFQLNTEAYWIEIFRSKFYKPKIVGLIELKLYLDFKNGINIENPIRNESVDPYSPFFETPCLYRKEVCMVNGSIPCDKLTLAQPSFAAAQLLKGRTFYFLICKN